MLIKIHNYESVSVQIFFTNKKTINKNLVGDFIMKIIVVILFFLIIQSVVMAEGKVIHHQIDSQILANAGELSNRELIFIYQKITTDQNWTILSCT